MKKVLLALIAASVPLTAHAQLPPAATVAVDYEKDVKPILAQNCYGCHGPDIQQSGLRLDLRQNALRGGDYGPVITPGKSSESKLIRRLVDGDGGMQMPPAGPLTSEEVGILRAWIDQGPEFRTAVDEAAAPQPVDPKLAALITVVRSGSQSALEKIVAADPALVKSHDAGGSTPLHHAAGFGTLDAITKLLDAGADVNAKNRRGSTPLHWAVYDESKVRLLLSRGASINAKQVEGRTPVFLAASFANSHTVLRVLLERGADANVATANGQTPLMAAARRGDIEALRLLLDAKANVNAIDGAGETALMLAASDDDPRAVSLLLDRGADPRVRTKRNETALGNAATAGNEHTVRLLLERGAEINVRNIRGYSPLMLAASSDAMPAGVVKLLLAKGADTSFTGDYDETARDLASKRGDTEVARLLGGSRYRSTVALAPRGTTARPSSAQAVEKAFVLLEQQSHKFIRTAGCHSCHAQALPSAVAGFARSRGLRVPEIPQLPESMLPSPERLMDFSLVGIGAEAWELFDAGMNGLPSTPYSDAVVRVIKATQSPAGNWSANESRRPPMNAGEYTAAALAIYAIDRYSPPGERASSDEAIARAAAWLERAKPTTTQDRAFHALALAWAGRSESAKTAARALRKMQRSDGGWSQLPGLDSDAYATGQALFALYAAGQMAVTDPVYQRGVDYLLRTQATDGTWHVKSRAIWLQPYFESGFPYGQDQFISAAGTAWASMALAATVQPTTSTREQ